MRRREHGPRLPRDLEVLASPYGEDLDARPLRADLGITCCAGVAIWVDFESEITEPHHRASPDLGGVLAHPSGENKRIESAQRSRHRRDAGTQTVQIHLYAQPGFRLTPGRAIEHLPHVCGPGQPDETRTMLEGFRHLMRAQAHT